MATYLTHEEAVNNHPDCDVILKSNIDGNEVFEPAYCHEDGIYDHAYEDSNNPYGGLFVMRTEHGQHSSSEYWVVSKIELTDKSK